MAAVAEGAVHGFVCARAREGAFGVGRFASRGDSRASIRSEFFEPSAATDRTPSQPVPRYG